MYHPLARKILIVILLGVVVYAIILLIPNEDYRRPLFRKDMQDVDTASVQVPIDTTLVRSADTYTYIFSDGKPTRTPATEIVIPSTVVVMDSDSVTRYNLYRKGKEAVHIDLEEHKEPVFFTWEDVKTWWRIIREQVTGGR